MKTSWSLMVIGGLLALAGMAALVYYQMTPLVWLSLIVMGAAVFWGGLMHHHVTVRLRGTEALQSWVRRMSLPERADDGMVRPWAMELDAWSYAQTLMYVHEIVVTGETALDPDRYDPDLMHYWLIRGDDKPPMPAQQLKELRILNPWLDKQSDAARWS